METKRFSVFVSRTIQCCKLLARFAARMFMKIRPMESNLLNSASDFLYHTHFYFNILSLAAKISARWLHCHKHGTCYSIVSCSPLILIGAHFSSLAINQLHDLSLFKKMTKKRPSSEIYAFKNLDLDEKFRTNWLLLITSVSQGSNFQVTRVKIFIRFWPKYPKYAQIDCTWHGQNIYKDTKP
jgi:hypothetical protein